MMTRPSYIWLDQPPAESVRLVVSLAGQTPCYVHTVTLGGMILTIGKRFEEGDELVLDCMRASPPAPVQVSVRLEKDLEGVWEALPGGAQQVEESQ